MDKITEEEKMASIEKMVKNIMEYYESFRKFPFIIVSEHNDNKLQELHKNGKIDLDTVVTTEGQTLREYLSEFNAMVKRSFELKEDSKELIKEALTEVMMEDGAMALTPKQRLFMQVALDLSNSSAHAYQLFRQKNSDILAFKEMQANRSLLKKISKKLAKIKDYIASIFKSKKVEAPQPDDNKDKEEGNKKSTSENIDNPNFDCENKNNCTAPNCYCTPVDSNSKVEFQKQESFVDTEAQSEITEKSDFDKIPDVEYDILSEETVAREYMFQPSDLIKTLNKGFGKKGKRGRPKKGLSKLSSELFREIKNVLTDKTELFTIPEMIRLTGYKRDLFYREFNRIVRLKYIIQTGNRKNRSVEYRLASWDDYKQSKTNKGANKSVNQVKVSKDFIETALHPILTNVNTAPLTPKEIEVLDKIKEVAGTVFPFEIRPMSEEVGIIYNNFYWHMKGLVKKGYAIKLNEQKGNVKATFKLTDKKNK